MGFRIVLYIRNLFSIDNSDFLPRIQYTESQLNQYDLRNVGLLAIEPPNAVASPKMFY
jgi:hypothetical protein